MTNNPDDGFIFIIITITRYLTEDGNDIVAYRIDGDDNVMMALGMLALTNDTILRQAASEHDED